MARRNKPIPRNWDDEPDIPEDEFLGANLEPGDLIRPKVPLAIVDSKFSMIDGHPVTVPVRGSKFRTEDGEPTVSGELQGIYVGQKRLLTPKKVTVNKKSWTGKRKMSQLYTMHHIAIFCGRKVIVKLDEIEKVQ